jgi:hypothetical protein
MSGYRKTVRRQAIAALILFLISGSQTVINWQLGFGISYAFLIYSLIFLVYGLLMVIDLRDSETRSIIVRIHRVRYNWIKVIKPNGRKKSLQIPISDMGRYQIGDELELTLGKRTRQVLEVNLHSREEVREA